MKCNKCQFMTTDDKNGLTNLLFHKIIKGHDD